MTSKRTIIYGLPHGPYNGILSFANITSRALSDRFSFRYVYFSFLDWSRIKKKVMQFLPPILKYKILSRKDFQINEEKEELIRKADLIHFWHPEFAGIFRNNKYIVSCWGIELLPQIIRETGTFFFNSVFQHAFIIHTPSESTRKLILTIGFNENLPRKKIITIPPYIDYAMFQNNKDSLVKKGKTPVIGTLCRFESGKNVLRIVEALNFLKRKLKIDFHFLLAGDGDEKNMILNLLRKFSIPFTYLGKISEENKIRFYQTIDVFVLPTFPSNYNREGFGLVYIEANSCGVPVVASKDGGVQEAVSPRESGIFADYKNIEDIAFKIKELIGKKDFYSNSTKKWASKFDFHKHIEKFENLYEKALLDG